MYYRAPAKVNLFLEVVGRRPDGYHMLDTVFQTVGLYDTLSVAKRKSGISFWCSDSTIPCDDTNLVVKAAKLLQEETGCQMGASIRLWKRIPSGAGLGGGSSDAATTLRALIDVWGIAVDNKKRIKIATRLGADVPFFLFGGTMHAGGIGEVLNRWRSIKKTWFVLVNPGIGVPTAGIYKNLHFPLTNKRKSNRMSQAFKQGKTVKNWGAMMFNRLEEVVFPRYPHVRAVCEVLRAAELPAIMSGSGATVFAVARSFTEAKAIQANLRQYGWKIWVVESIPGIRS